MKKTQDKYYLYLVASLGIIVFGIITTNIVNQFQAGKTTDARARASSATALKISATVIDKDTATNSLQITNLAFEDTKTKLNGNWSVSLPTTIQADSFTSGTQVILAVDATRFMIADKTMIALDVRRR